RDSHTRESRHDLLEQLQQFSTQLCAETCQACDVSPRVGEASDEPNSNRIATACHHNGDRTGGFLCVMIRSGTCCDNYVEFEADELDSELGPSLALASRRSVFNGNVPTFHVAEITQPLQKCLVRTGRISRCKITDPRYFWRLRLSGHAKGQEQGGYCAKSE